MRNILSGDLIHEGIVNMNIDFSFWLLVLTVASGIITAIDKFKFEPKRLSSVSDKIQHMNKKEYHKFIQQNNHLKAPLLAEYSRSLFSVFLIIFILRAFIIGNFFIPSASMNPTLFSGDFILVNKMAYGIRSPLNNNIWIDIGNPKRGDIAVFQFPVNRDINFIKRVVGIPGDIISYQDKKLTINGIPAMYIYYSSQQITDDRSTTYTENVELFAAGHQHQINITNNSYSEDFTNLVVPENMYFVMGDNRDNSEDSRYWGFVSKDYLLGKAFFIWFSWNNENKSVRWDQIGQILK